MCCSILRRRYGNRCLNRGRGLLPDRVGRSFTGLNVGDGGCLRGWRWRWQQRDRVGYYYDLAKYTRLRGEGVLVSWYSNAPALLNVTFHCLAGAIAGEEKLLSVAVIAIGTVDAFTNTTVS